MTRTGKMQATNLIDLTGDDEELNSRSQHSTDCSRQSKLHDTFRPSKFLDRRSQAIKGKRRRSKSSDNLQPFSQRSRPWTGASVDVFNRQRNVTQTADLHNHRTAQNLVPTDRANEYDDPEDGAPVSRFQRALSIKTSSAVRTVERLPIPNRQRNDSPDSEPIVETPAATRPYESIIPLDDCMTDGEFEKHLQYLQAEEKQKQKVALEELREIDSYKRNGVSFATGKGIEMQDGTFFRIDKVLRNGRGEFYIRGKKLVRPDLEDTIMPRHRPNEIIWEQHIRDASSTNCESTVLVSNDILRNRDIVFTNHRYPRMSSNDDGNTFGQSGQNEAQGALFCRLKRTVVVYQGDRLIETCIENLGYDEADNKLRWNKANHRVSTRMPAKQLRFEWRGLTTDLGGSQKVQREAFDTDGNIHKSTDQEYTFGDAFCGAGGVSRGADAAGVSIKWGFDHDREAMDTYTANFAHHRHGTDCHQVDVPGFIRLASSRSLVVDILHMSPPCQPFSAAHTIAAPSKDEPNQAAMFSPQNLCELIKPRIVTMEETDGLLNRHSAWFSALINIFISLGYSIRWKVLRCEEYGVPQTRKRLFIIAAAPGEKLPPFARPTHGANNPSLKRLVTIHDAIRNIPASAADHNPSAERYSENERKRPFSAATQAKTITCHGGGNHHPSGTRRYTVRELACLQTFPIYHQFIGARGKTAAKQQIGNAVPPVMAKTIFREIIKFLKASDSEEARENV